jgi:hypothetical protein
MNKIGNWFKKQMTGLFFAFSNVEKNALGQEKVELSSDTDKFQRHLQGTLLDALNRGEITQEVKELRWRLFKVLHASDKLMVKQMMSDNGQQEIKVKKLSPKQQKSLLKKIKLDEFDDYELELVVDNSEITLSSFDIINNENIKEYEENEMRDSIQEDEDGEKTATLGEISSGDYVSSLKAERPIKVIRDLRPKFELEKYTKKLNVRKINEKERLLEFYVTKYPDKYDRKTPLFLSELKRTIKNPRFSSIIDIQAIGFTTYKTVGSKDFYQYQYKINKFDKIVEFNGYYIIKFKSEVIVDGEYLLEKFRVNYLDEKYKNKERKN